MGPDWQPPTLTEFRFPVGPVCRAGQGHCCMGRRHHWVWDYWPCIGLLQIFFKPLIVLFATCCCDGAAFALFTGTNSEWCELLWPVVLLMSQRVPTLAKYFSHKWYFTHQYTRSRINRVASILIQLAILRFNGWWMETILPNGHQLDLSPFICIIITFVLVWLCWTYMVEIKPPSGRLNPLQCLLPSTSQPRLFNVT